MIIAVIYATQAVAKRKPEKSGLNGIRPHDLCDASAVLYQLSYKPTGSWSFCEFVLYPWR